MGRSGESWRWRLDNRDQALRWLGTSRFTDPARSTRLLPLNYRISLFYRIMRTEFWRNIASYAFSPDSGELDACGIDAQVWSETLFDQLSLLSARVTLVDAVVNIRNSIADQRVQRSVSESSRTPDLTTGSGDASAFIDREVRRVLPILRRYNPRTSERQLKRIARRSFRQWGWGNQSHSGHLRRGLIVIDRVVRILSRGAGTRALYLRCPTLQRPIPLCIGPRTPNKLAPMRYTKYSTEDFLRFLLGSGIDADSDDLVRFQRAGDR